MYATAIAPAVSGAIGHTYQELCVAAKNEEHRQLANLLSEAIL